MQAVDKDATFLRPDELKMGKQRMLFLVISEVILDNLIGLGDTCSFLHGQSHSALPLPVPSHSGIVWYTCETVCMSLGGHGRQHVLSRRRVAKQPSEACSWSASWRCAASVESTAASLPSHTHGVWSWRTAARHLAKWMCVSRLWKLLRLSRTSCWQDVNIPADRPNRIAFPPHPLPPPTLCLANQHERIGESNSPQVTAPAGFCSAQPPWEVDCSEAFIVNLRWHRYVCLDLVCQEAGSQVRAQCQEGEIREGMEWVGRKIVLRMCQVPALGSWSENRRSLYSLVVRTCLTLGMWSMPLRKGQLLEPRPRGRGTFGVDQDHWLFELFAEISDW